MTDRFQKQRKRHGKDKREIKRQFHSHRKGMLLRSKVVPKLGEGDKKWDGSLRITKDIFGNKWVST